MSLNPAFLIEDASLQEYLVDKVTGLPLANGVVTFYEDTARTTLKPVYTQTGSPGSYTYAALPNPLILSSVGTTVDLSGNDIKIFYYPYDVNSANFNAPTPQPYYVTVVNSASQPQFVRQNWPFVPGGSPVNTAVPTLDNLVVNNEFWRNVGSSENPVSGTVLAPSQHDGFRVPDITYQKDGTGETETISFVQFPYGVQTLTDDVTPEFYLDFNCTGAGSSTVKYIYIPISLHLLTLGDYSFGTITIQANNIAGTGTLDLYILADLGTGKAPATPTLIDQVTANSSWTKFQTAPFTFPSSVAQSSLSKGGDDGFYLVIGVPAGVTHLQIAKPSLFLSDNVPTNDFQSYDKIDAVISSPRTGDVRTSINSFAPFGWVAANNLSIGSATSGATNRANIDTWPLYNLLWNNVSDTFAPVAGGRGVSAIADFGTNNAVMTLPKMLGRVLMGLPLTQTATYSHLTSLFTVTDATLYYVGTPVILTTTVTLPNAFTANTVYYTIPVSPTTFALASSYANALTATTVPAGTTDGTGTLTINPQLAGSIGEPFHTQLEVELASHAHTFSAHIEYANSNVGGGGTPTYREDSSGGTALTINTDGSSTPFNVIQPSVYMNVYLKL